MRRRTWNRLIQLGMTAVLFLTGWPLLRPWLPARPLPVLPLGQGDMPPVPGKLVVDARDNLSPAAVQALGSRYRLSIAYHSAVSQGSRLLVADVPPGQEDAILARLRKDRDVEAADRLNRVRAYWTPNDPRFREQWNMKMVRAEEAWDKTSGKGVVVAVIDTGVAFEIDEKCYRARDFAGTSFTKGYDFVYRDAHPNDDHGHGTHVSGTIAETTNNGEGVAGLAFGSTIMPLKVLDEYGSGTSAAIADAVRFAADNGANVINMSLGGPFPDSVMHSACQYAAKKGVLIVCAAGNSGGGPVGYPAAFPECLAVSAVGPSGELAPYSSVGREVAIAAPGGDTNRGEDPAGGVLQNTVMFGSGEREDGYFAFNGTSMASPHVAAAAALAISRGVKDPAQVRSILQRAAKPKKPAKQYGAGILDAAKTVQLADTARRDSWLTLVSTVIAGLLGVGVGVIRGGVAGLARFPNIPFGLGFGLLGPDLLAYWMGFGSPFNIIVHSALIPLYLLWEAESPVVYRFVAAAAVGTAAHLAWDAARGAAPFGWILPEHALPWLCVNSVVALGIALVAFRRAEGA